MTRPRSIPPRPPPSEHAPLGCLLLLVLLGLFLFDWFRGLP